MASCPLRCLMRACAACSGLPTSGRTPSAATAERLLAANARPAHRTTCNAMRFITSISRSIQELLGSDEADLRDSLALRRGHHVGDVLVGHELVGPQVEFRLHRHLR